MGLADWFGIENPYTKNEDGSVTYKENDDIPLADFERYFYVNTEISETSDGRFATSTGAATDANKAVEVVKDAATSVLFDIGKIGLYIGGALVAYTFVKSYAAQKGRALA